MTIVDEALDGVDTAQAFLIAADLHADRRPIITERDVNYRDILHDRTGTNAGARPIRVMDQNLAGADDFLHTATWPERIWPVREKARMAPASGA